MPSTELEVVAGTVVLDVEFDEPEQIDTSFIEPEDTIAIIIAEGPPGQQGRPGTGTRIVGEVPVGELDGTNTVFMTEVPYLPGTITLYLNGLREMFFEETSSDTITLSDPPLSGDQIVVDYIMEV